MKILYFVPLLVLLAGCKPSSVSTHVSDSDEALAISNLNRRVIALETNQKDWVAIDPDSKSYEQLRTQFGALLVSTRSVTPYLDGYKVKVAIGNPYYITFSGFKLERWVAKAFTPPPLSAKGTSSSIQTGTVAALSNPQRLPQFDPTKPWEHSWPITIEDRTETLQPGSWTGVEFTVAPATSDDIRHLRVSIVLNEVHLNEDSSN